MKIYLVKDVKGKGKSGDIIDVSDGYANNFLIPKNMAKAVNKSIMLEKKSKDESKKFHQKQERDAAEKTARKLERKKVSVVVKAGINGKIYGSITPKEVASAIKSQYGVDVDKRKIELPDIRDFGDFDFVIKIMSGIIVKMIVNVSKN